MSSMLRYDCNVQNHCFALSHGRDRPKRTHMLQMEPTTLMKLLDMTRRPHNSWLIVHWPAHAMSAMLRYDWIVQNHCFALSHGRDRPKRTYMLYGAHDAHETVRHDPTAAQLLAHRPLACTSDFLNASVRLNRPKSLLRTFTWSRSTETYPNAVWSPRRS